ncbi:MAG: aminomethyl-transferring glycine dehydrogenase subunit GcvPA [Fervidicoccaceae archaeon]
MRSAHPWIPNDDEKIIEEMLKTIGINDPMELFSDIPKEFLLNRKLKVGRGIPLSSISIEREMASSLMDVEDIPLYRIFAGGPVAPHYTHPVVDAIISRGEILTAYTPYQPEISQGLLKMLFEYQSAMAVLYGVEIVNAGMYDGATALAEASLMSVRVKKNKKILVPSTLFEEYKSVLKTYFQGHEISYVEYSFDEETGEINSEELSKIRNEKGAGVIVDYPSNTGEVRKTTAEIIQEAHNANSIAIAFSDPSSLGILAPPGDLGVDIVVGEGQSLGLPLYGGGMLLGILGIRNDRELLRNLPGRLIGETVDADGNIGYAMILQSREQHIRREKATSNITTGASLNAIAALVSLALKGSRGLRKEGSKILELTGELKKKLSENGLEIIHPRALHYKNIAFRFPSGKDSKKIFMRMVKERSIIPFSMTVQGGISCATEVHEREDIEIFGASLREVLSNGI